MANTPGGNCEHCGRSLRPQSGKGRQRRYCNATCRSAARRRRSTGGAAFGPALTADTRKFDIDAVTRASEVSPLLGAASDTSRLLVAQMSGSEGSPLPAVATARELSRLVDQLMRIAVERTREHGHTWQEIGEMLGTTRQAAFQRFGRPIDPRTGVPMARAILSGAVELAVQLVADLADGRYQQAGRDFTAAMSEQLPAKRLAAAWAHVAGMVGAYERMGDARAYQAGDYTVVDVALSFEAGEVTARVSYDSAGKVAGLYLLPADPARFGPSSTRARAH